MTALTSADGPLPSPTAAGKANSPQFQRERYYPHLGFYVLNGQSSWNHDNGGYATLFSASGEMVDKTATRTDNLGNDFTYGRHPDGHDTNTDGDWGLGSATKGTSNVR